MNLPSTTPSNAAMSTVSSRWVPTVAVLTAALTLTMASVAFAVNTGARAPAIDANDTSGHRVSLSAHRGSVVLVDFWATWCEPCADSMPVLESLHQRFGSRGLVVIGVSQDRNASAIAPFARRHGVTFPIVHDAGNAIAGRYSPPRMPTTYLIDRAGIVRHVHAGYRSGDAATLEREITALLGS